MSSLEKNSSDINNKSSSKFVFKRIDDIKDEYTKDDSLGEGGYGWAIFFFFFNL